jgi:hypothetical protein
MDRHPVIVVVARYLVHLSGAINERFSLDATWLPTNVGANQMKEGSNEVVCKQKSRADSMGATFLGIVRIRSGMRPSITSL